MRAVSGGFVRVRHGSAWSRVCISAHLLSIWLITSHFLPRRRGSEKQVVGGTGCARLFLAVGVTLEPTEPLWVAAAACTGAAPWTPTRANHRLPKPIWAPRACLSGQDSPTCKTSMHPPVLGPATPVIGQNFFAVSGRFPWPWLSRSRQLQPWQLSSSSHCSLVVDLGLPAVIC
jgi:hypothetical protein